MPHKLWPVKFESAAQLSSFSPLPQLPGSHFSHPRSHQFFCVQIPAAPAPAASSTRTSTTRTSTSTSSTSASTTSASKMPILPARSARTILRKCCTQHRKNRNSTTVSRDRHAGSYERVALSTAKSQFYYSFVRSTRSILRKGCTQHRKIAILLTVSCDRHARSHERVHPAQTKSQFYYSFVQSTRTISRKGSSSTNEIAILLQFRAIDTRHDLTKGFIQHKRNRNLTIVSCDRHARSYERVAFPQAFSGTMAAPLKNIMLYLML